MVGAVAVLLVGRVANGILGIEWLSDRIRLPWVARAPPGAVPADAGGRRRHRRGGLRRRAGSRRPAERAP